MFLEPWCVITRMRVGKLSICGERCLSGGYGDVWKDRGRKFFVVGGEFPAPFFAFFVFLPRNGHFCAHVCQKRHGDIAHKPVCVRGKGKGEGGGRQNKKML